MLTCSKCSAMYSNHFAGDVMQAGEGAASLGDRTNIAVTQVAVKNVCANATAEH